MKTDTRVQWYDHDCDWISKYCDEHHLQSLSVSDLIAGLEVAMLGTTDGDFIDPDSDIPAGEMFRLASEYVDDVFGSARRSAGSES